MHVCVGERESACVEGVILREAVVLVELKVGDGRQEECSVGICVSNAR